MSTTKKRAPSSAAPAPNPPAPSSTRRKGKIETMRVRYARGESAEWRRAARAELLTLSAWVRRTLAREAKRINARAKA